ncbi:F-box domain-containing protein [Histoplasma capsulatum var. duboisii H88]|uniref:F-box domain-containing protein n=1 Tax=Ajellomyces capsulatus (strain H88) TaxID=544711 RepID=F0UT51_AJEC8|nr:F-box domain-containing protein [Histoplasma capsulatum var. duboisii H88]
MLSSSSGLAPGVIHQQTPIPPAVRSIRKHYRKFVNWLNKAALQPSHKKVGNQGQLRQISFQEAKTSPLLNLPLELVLIINGLLPLESQVCLALTCKTLLRLNKQALAAPQFKFLPNDVYDREFMKNCDNFNTERWRLLRLLENDQWHCCSTCLKLHPTNVVTKISALISGDGELFICTQYAVFARALRVSESIAPLRRVFCPHLSFYDYLLLFSGSRSELDLQARRLWRKHPFNIPSEAFQRGLYCQYCDTTIYVVRSNLNIGGYRRNLFFEVMTVRNLGRRTCVDDTWRYQTVYPSSWSGFGNTPFKIRYPRSLREIRDSRKHSPWAFNFCFHRILTSTENKSHRWPAVLENPLTSNDIPPVNEHLHDSDINIDGSYGFIVKVETINRRR